MMITFTIEMIKKLIEEQSFFKAFNLIKKNLLKDY